MHSLLPAPQVSAFTLFARATSRTVKKAALFLLSVALLLAGGTAAVRGQSALDGFDPNANGTIRVIVVQPDGKILIGGDFTTLSPNGGREVPRSHIARLNPDGTLDLKFNPNVTGPANTLVTVYAIALQADGKILIGGSFTTLTPRGELEMTRTNIARVETNGGLDVAFKPNANGIVRSIAVQANRMILVGGDFHTLDRTTNSIGEEPRNRIARLDDQTGKADGFNPDANGSVHTIAVQADGKILVGGEFNDRDNRIKSIGQEPRNRIARLNEITGKADGFNPNANNIVYAIAVQADGKILVGGLFNDGGNGIKSIGQEPRNRIARLEEITGKADGFNPKANNSVFAIAVQADGKILVGGAFKAGGDGRSSIGQQRRDGIARLNEITGKADGFNPKANNSVLAIAVQADGKILAGGVFNGANSIGTDTRNCIARLEIDGTLDQTLNLKVTGLGVNATAVQPDGKFLIGGFFDSVLHTPRKNIARLNADGTLDTEFKPEMDAGVYSIAVQADGKILVSGLFDTVDRKERKRIARLEPTGELDEGFDATAGNGGVFSIAVQADRNILVGGSFDRMGGLECKNIARLKAANGKADNSFAPNPDGPVYVIVFVKPDEILIGGAFKNLRPKGERKVERSNIARLAANGRADGFKPNADEAVFSIAVQADGKILAGGSFHNVGGHQHDYIALLNGDSGTDDMQFDPEANGDVYAIALQADRKILVGGAFTMIGIRKRKHIARLGTNGFADDFDPGANGVFSIVVQADGKILVSGNGRDTAGGQSLNLFARLSNDTAARQNLAVTRTTITWTRAGASPQFNRATFEVSFDNVIFGRPLNATKDDTNWILTGLNLPTGENIYIRARGYYRGGRFHGSESISESVRNAFLAAPAATPAPSQAPSPNPSPTPSPTPMQTPTPPPSATPTATPSGTPPATATATAAPTPTPTSTPSGTPSATPCGTSVAFANPASITINDAAVPSSRQ